MELTTAPPLLAIPFQLPSRRIRLALNRLSPADHSLSFLGSTWRGAFGAALRENHCLSKQPTCVNCTVTDQCLLSGLFDNTIPSHSSGILKHYQNAPQPYALHPPSPHHANANLDLQLFGRFTPIAEHCAQALLQCVEKHLNAPKYQVESLRITEQLLQPQQAPSLSNTIIRIQLQSPLQLREQSKLVTAHNLHFSTWFTALLRRMSNLQRYYTEHPLNADFAALKQRAQSLSIQNPKLHRFSQSRWSNRKNKTMPMTGIQGHFDIDLSNAPELWPLIWAGQHLQLGRLTTMGFGKYQIQNTSLPNTTTPSKTAYKGSHPAGAKQ